MQYNTNSRLPQPITGIPLLDKQIDDELRLLNVTPRYEKTEDALIDSLIDESLQASRDLLKTINSTVSNFGVKVDHSDIMRNLPAKQLTTRQFMGV